MLQFLRRKIKPFKKCTGNPSYSFEIKNPSHQVTTASKTEQDSTDQLDSLNDYEHTGCSQYNFTSKLENKKKSFSKKNRFYLKFKRSNGSKSKSDSLFSSSEFNNNSLNNREATNSLIATSNETDLKTGAVAVFDSPVSSANSNYELNQWNSDSDIQSYTDDDCLNDLIDNTNYTQNCLAISPNNNNSMVTYNTKYANNSNIIFENGLTQIKSLSSKNLQQSTPFDETESPANIRVKRAFKRQSKVISEHGGFEPIYRKSKNFQSTNDLIVSNIDANASPLFRKMEFKSRKCRRSNTTFTMAGNKKNKIIDYFNNLEIKPMKKNQKMYCSNKEIAAIRLIEENAMEKSLKPSLDMSGDSKVSETSTNLGKSKNEVEKIQDLFFYDESLLSNRGSNEVENLTGDKLILSTFLDSPVSVVTEKSSTETTPIFREHESSKHIKLNGIASNSNSVEKFRRSSSMPGLIEQNLSIQANNSKINTLKGLEDDLNVNITPKKALIFDQNDAISNNSIENLSTPQRHLISSFEVCDDEPKPFVRGQSRNLSKNIKQMFKNVIKLQMNALSNLEKFYEAQLLKVEADRRQNLELNPMNKEKINEFFDKQLELLEERVQINLENISKDKSRKMYSSSNSLKFENTDEESDDSIQKMSKKILSQKLAQIISSNNQTCTSSSGFSRRSQSKNLLELKNNLINQNNLLPSKHQANQSNDFSPKSSMFKRNLSLPFKQCKQNKHRVRNESAHEIVDRLNSPVKIDSFMADYDSSIERNESAVEIKKAHEISERFTNNNMAKIVKLNKTDAHKSFVVSSNSAFKPVRRDHSQQNLFTQSAETYEEMNGNESIIFKPSSLDVRRNSSIFYMDDSNESCERRNMPMPRLSDSHLLFKIKQEKRMNENKRIGVSNYQKQYQSKITQNFMARSISKSNFHIETEV